MMRIRQALFWFPLAGLLAAFPAGGQEAGDPPADMARKTVSEAIDAMGGEAYLDMRTLYNHGNWFIFDRHGRRSRLVKFWEYIEYDPIKWYFQLGKGGRQNVQVYNLELNKAWLKEGKKHVEELPEDRIERFRKSAKHDLDVLLRERFQDKEDNKLFYYGPDDITGDGDLVAVEFLDEANDSAVVYFDRDSKLPSRIEYKIIDKMGNRLRQSEEFYNWHSHNGVMIPMRRDTFREGNLIQQRHATESEVNPTIPPGQFLRPEVDD